MSSVVEGEVESEDVAMLFKICLLLQVISLLATNYIPGLTKTAEVVVTQIMPKLRPVTILVMV